MLQNMQGNFEYRLYGKLNIHTHTYTRLNILNFEDKWYCKLTIQTGLNFKIKHFDISKNKCA